jgi:hypothetical protein
MGDIRSKAEWATYLKLAITKSIPLSGSLGSAPGYEIGFIRECCRARSSVLARRRTLK